MPIHDWTRVPAGIFHHFHHEWISAIVHALNGGILPPDCYALAEQVAGGLGPDVLTLQWPGNGSGPAPAPAGGVAVATAPPKVDMRARADGAPSVRKLKSVVVHHVSNDRVIALVEIISPGNKNNEHGIRSLVEKLEHLLRASVHLLVIDLFPSSSRDPHGLPHLLWERFGEDDLTLPEDRTLSVAAYAAGASPEAFVQPLAVGQPLPEMPLFLTSELYVPVPLETTYDAAWTEVPTRWREAVSGTPPP